MKTEKWTIEFNQDVPNQYIINDDNGRICYIAPQPDCLRLPQDRLEGKIAAFIVDACNNYERVKAENEQLKSDLDVMGIDGMVMRLIAEKLQAQRDELAAALRGLLANAPAPKNVKFDYHYMVHIEAARAALAKLEDK